MMPMYFAAYALRISEGREGGHCIVPSTVFTGHACELSAIRSFAMMTHFLMMPHTDFLSALGHLDGVGV